MTENPDNLPASKSSPLSPRLCALVSRPGPASATLAELDSADLAVLRWEAKALIAEAKRTSSPDDIRRALTPLVLVFGVGEAAKAEAFWKAYNTALASLHPEALERAAGKWIEVGKFFPKPAELRDLARVEPLACVRIAEHAHAALSYQPPKVLPPRDIAKLVAGSVQAMPDAPGRTMPIIREELRVHPMVAKPLPSIAGRTDETGLTPQMRALLHRETA